MLGILTKTTCPMGIDLDHDSLRIAQLVAKGDNVAVVDCQWVARPASVQPNSPQWQHWAIDAIGQARANGRFNGKDIVVALPPTEIHVDHVKCPKPSEGKLDAVVFSKIKSKLPTGWTRDNIIIKCIPTEQDNILAIAAERAIVERHLAIYERVRLKVKSMVVWPVAVANCYARFFARRSADQHAVVMLLDIQSDCSNVVICRGGNLLLADSIAIGARRLGDTTEADRLAWELTARRKKLLSLYKDVGIERLILLSGAPGNPDVCQRIGAELGVRVQLADCQAALGIEATSDDDEVQTNWTLAFGLSLC
jgi:Tfp pilus assembly PilM family ATPase